jgi:hypothetical protein
LANENVRFRYSASRYKDVFMSQFQVQLHDFSPHTLVSPGTKVEVFVRRRYIRGFLRKFITSKENPEKNPENSKNEE